MKWVLYCGQVQTLPAENPLVLREALPDKACSSGRPEGFPAAAISFNYQFRATSSFPPSTFQPSVPSIQALVAFGLL